MFNHGCVYVLRAPKKLTEVNSQKYNGYHLFRKDTKAGVRTLQSHCMTKVCLNITSINRILKIQQFLPLSFSYLSDYLPINVKRATERISSKGMWICRLERRVD